MKLDIRSSFKIITLSFNRNGMLKGTGRLDSDIGLIVLDDEMNRNLVLITQETICWHSRFSHLNSKIIIRTLQSTQTFSFNCKTFTANRVDLERKTQGELRKEAKFQNNTHFWKQFKRTQLGPIQF